MNTTLKAAMGAFYVVATVIMAGTFYRGWNHSWVYAGHALALYLVSVVLPALWTRTLVEKLRGRGIALDDLQWAIVMPSWCAAVTALIALQLVRP